MTEPVTDPVIAADAPEGEPAAFGVPLAVAALVLFSLGIVLGVLGMLVVPLRWRLLGVAVPVAWAAALINFTAGRLAQGSMERWWAPAIPFGGWALVVASMSFFTPGGDKIFAYDDVSTIYVALGMLGSAATVGTAATPARHSGR